MAHPARQALKGAAYMAGQANLAVTHGTTLLGLHVSLDKTQRNHYNHYQCLVCRDARKAWTKRSKTIILIISV